MIVVKDAAIEPFRIHIDEDQFSVVRTQISQKGKSEGKELIFPVAYCSTFEHAIKVVVRQKLCKADQELSLKAFVDAYREIAATIIDSVKIPQ